jgi:hypothetical protein
MSIAIVNRPYDGITDKKITPVYNGLPFVVDSTFKDSSNMRYIAEIYVNSIKIGELRHNPDISNDNKGMFNIGRIVEGYLGYNLNWNINGGTLAPQSLVDYYVSFGEEFSRLNRIKSITSYSGTYGINKVKLTFYEPHKILLNDRILVQGTTITGLNTFHKAVPSGGITSVVLPDVTYTGQGNLNQAYILAGEPITQFLSYVGPDGVTYVSLKVKSNTLFSIGDMIQIKQDTVTYTQYENIEWSIVNIIKTTSGGTSYSTIQTTIPYAGPIASTITGSIISRNNYVIRDQWSSKNDGSQTFNGAVQYAEYLTWTPTPYLFGAPTSSNASFLTSRPRKEIDVCKADWMTLSLFGTNNILNGIKPDNIMYETWSTPIVGTLTPLSNTNVTALGGTRLKVVLSGNQTEFKNGSYVTLFVGTTTYTRRVLQKTFTIGITELLFDVITGAPTITSVRLDIVVGLNKINMPSNRAEIPAAPKNLTTIPEIVNASDSSIVPGAAYKYFIYAYKAGTYWFDNIKKSETFTFNIKCKCSKFQKFNMMWLNPLGGWDYFIFDKRSDHQRKIEKQEFTRHLNSYQGATGYKYKLGDRGRTTYNVASADNYTLRTDFLTQDQINWLSYIYESPEVYWIDNSTDKIYPVNLKNEEANVWKKVNFNDNGTLYTYEIDIELANDRVIQRGGNLNIKGGSTATTGSGGGVIGGSGGPYKPYTGNWLTNFTYTKSLYE